MGNLIDKMKQDVKKSGASKKKIHYVREGEKSRIRFLQELDSGYDFSMHNDYTHGINALCLEHASKNCPFCESEKDTMKTRTCYAFSIWDYDAREVKILFHPINQCTPLPHIVAMYENYGTIMDRDYVLSCNGKGTGKSYTVMPQDKERFRNEKAKPLSKSAMVNILLKAYPADDSGGDDEESEQEYNKMSARELYSLCVEKGIDVMKKQDKDYYIDKLADAAGDADEWDEDAEDYETMTPQELFKLCIDRGIDAEKKKAKKYYINLLEEHKKANDDWSDSEVDEDAPWGDDESDADEWE